MNTFEQRISDGLRDYAEGRDMTVDDVDRLELEFEHLLARRDETRRTERRTRIWQGAVAACAVTGVVLGAMALGNDPDAAPRPAETPPITNNTLTGIWRVDGEDAGGALWYFRPDGTMITATTAAALIDDSEGWAVTSTTDGFTLDNGKSGTDACDFTAASSMNPSGRMVLSMTTTTPSCPDAKSAGDWELTRISPLSVSSATLAPVWPRTEPEVLTGTPKLVGTWLLRGTGKVLAVAPAPAGQEPTWNYARYALHDLSESGAAETGTVEWQDDGWVFVLTPSGSTCSKAFEMAVYRTAALVTTVATGSCGLIGGSTDTWVRLN